MGFDDVFCQWKMRAAAERPVTETIRKLLSYLLDRRLPKVLLEKALEKPLALEDKKGSAEEVAGIIRETARQLQIEEPLLFLDKSVFPRMGDIYIRRSDGISPISQVSRLIHAIEDSPNTIMRLYVPDDIFQKATRLIRPELLSEHR
jgi:hypothetical protein